MLLEPPDVEQPAEVLADGRRPAEALADARRPVATPAQPDEAALSAQSDAEQREARLVWRQLVVPQASAQPASPEGVQREHREAAEPPERPAEVALVASMDDRPLLPARVVEGAGAESAAPSDGVAVRARRSGRLDAAAPSLAGA